MWIQVGGYDFLIIDKSPTLYQNMVFDHAPPLSSVAGSTSCRNRFKRLHYLQASRSHLARYLVTPLACPRHASHPASPLTPQSTLSSDPRHATCLE